MEKLKLSGGRLLSDIRQYGLVAAIMLVLYLAIHLISPAFCYMINLTGFPCAGCGMTRAALSLLTGQIERAVYLQPMIFPVVVFLLYCMFFRYIRGTKVPGFVRLLIVLVSVLLIFYIVRMYLYFPDRVPYVYMEDNLFARRISGYRDMVAWFVDFLHTHRS